MKKLIIPIILMITVLGTAFAQNLQVSATVDKQNIFIGQQIQLFLKAVMKKPVAAGWFQVDSFPHFEILKRSKIDSQQTSEGLFLQQTLTLTSWDSGHWAIPPFALQNNRTRPLAVAVSFSPMEPDQPYHDIKDILDVRKPVSENWYWYLVGLVVLIGLFLLFFPPKEKKTDGAVAGPAEDAYETALKRLGQLQGTEEAKYLFTELVNIFRFYLERKRNIASFSKTTDDLALPIDQLSLPHAQYLELLQTLRLSDMVKFARYQPQNGEKEQAIEVIKKNIIAIENLK
ncbi:MAG: hypothetical protein ACXVMS_01575 [Flavisolibacter sp.]